MRGSSWGHELRQLRCLGVYDHLFEWSYTKEVFLKRNVGFEGDLAESLDALTVDDPQMKFRKQFLSYWCAKVCR